MHFSFGILIARKSEKVRRIIFCQHSKPKLSEATNSTSSHNASVYIFWSVKCSFVIVISCISDGRFLRPIDGTICSATSPPVYIWLKLFQMPVKKLRKIGQQSQWLIISLCLRTKSQCDLSHGRCAQKLNERT